MLVEEKEFAEAMCWMATHHHCMIEGSAAVGIAALLHNRSFRTESSKYYYLWSCRCNTPKLCCWKIANKWIPIFCPNVVKFLLFHYDIIGLGDVSTLHYYGMERDRWNLLEKSIQT